MKILPWLLLAINVAVSQRHIEGDAWEVMGSVVFSVSVRDEYTWDAYESELVWAVDIVAMEVVSLMDKDWASRRVLVDVALSDHGRNLGLQITIPSSISRSVTPCEITVLPGDRCEDVFASVRLWVDGTENPIQVEDSFESIFNAAVELGRLQAVLHESFPELQVQVISETTVTEPPFIEGTFFEENDVDPVIDPPRLKTSESEDFSAGGIIGILISTIFLLGIAIAAMMVVRRKQRHTMYYNKDDLVIENKETDLIESFSQAGLEWGSPEIKAEKKEPCYPKAEDGSFSVEGLPDTDSYQPEISSPASPSSSNSASSPSSKASRVVDFTGEIKDSSEPPELIIHPDGLEATIIAGDWETLAAAAITIQGATGSSMGSFSQDWSHRDKSWYTSMDAEKAAALDRLVEQSDWAGVLEFATQFGSQII